MRIFQTLHVQFVLCLVCFILPERSHQKSRVIGGKNYKEGKWPFLVRLSIREERVNLVCGASLISRSWILTAAHCFYLIHDGKMLLPPARPLMLLGTVDKQGEWKTQGTKVVAISSMSLIHERFRLTDDDVKNDIALIKTKRPVRLTKYIKPIRINEDPSFPPDGTECVLVGWGCTSENDRMQSGYAKEVILPVVNTKVCTQYFYNLHMESKICAGSTGQFRRSSCEGDSGGPLVCKKGKKWYQVGLTSFASSEDISHRPSVFTRVSYYKDWIKSSLKK